MATIRDVAALARVSVATVSRVLNKNGYVKAETEAAVLKAMEELQYNPSAAARMLNGKKMGAIALVLPDISNPFFPELARGVEDTAMKQGFTVFLCNSDDQDNKRKMYVEALRKRSIDGMILASSALSQEEIDQIREYDIPVVVTDRASSHSGFFEIKVDNIAGTRLAMQHLLDAGCRKIAHIYGPQHLITARERSQAYEQFVQSFPWYTPSLLEPGYFQFEGGREAVRALLQRHPDIDGIFAGNDLMAIGALKELRRMGRSVPDDVAVCGFDGIHLAEITEPELTTVAQPIYQIGALACGALMSIIQGEPSEQIVNVLDVQLLARDSTRRG